ncbi:MAG: hypothetical protein ACT4PI_12995 [Actinomycetota bacterium]
MTARLPSLDVIAREVRAERDTQFRHVDAVDAKAGVILGFSGVLVAVGVGAFDLYRLPALLSALLAAGTAGAVFRPKRNPTWDLASFRDERLRSEAVFTELALLDTHIDMIESQRALLHRNTLLLGWSLRALVAAAVLLVAGTLIDHLGG